MPLCHVLAEINRGKGEDAAVCCSGAIVQWMWGSGHLPHGEIKSGSMKSVQLYRNRVERENVVCLSSTGAPRGE